MKVEEQRLTGVKLIKPAVHEDHRGFFTESYQEAAWREAGIEEVFIQDNHSLSREAGTIRGLHLQIEEAAQAKLIRVLAGSIYDVVVDLRPHSSTFKQWMGFTLSANQHHQLLVPKGFAHGFCTLEADTQVFYKVDQLYNRDKERGIYWADPDLNINWPVSQPQLSDKDKQLPALDVVLSEIYEKDGIV